MHVNIIKIAREGKDNSLFLGNRVNCHGHFRRPRLVPNRNMRVTSSTSTTQDHDPKLCESKSQLLKPVFPSVKSLSPQEHIYQVLMLVTTGQKSKENRESKQSNKPFSDVKHFHMGRGLCKIRFSMEMTELQEAIGCNSALKKKKKKKDIL